jgi:hypothetical protein
VSRVEVLSWDYKEQPDLNMLGQIVREMSGGRVHLTAVEDTGDQYYAVIVAARPFEQDAATEIYRYWLESGKADEA